jgi:hypothetical protein
MLMLNTSMIYLYKKTHRVTGLQYLGKTARPDPYTYPGSGKRWRAHLDKHGYEFDTEILIESEDPLEIARMGVHYSNLWNVVEDDSWANLKPESGDGGTFVHTSEAKKKIGDARRGKASGFKGKSYNEIQKDSEAAKQRRENHSKLMLENNPFKGKSHSLETRQKMTEAAKLRSTLTEEDRKDRWGHHKGKPWSEARRAAQLAKKLNKGKQ